jgi:low temperature requirement protein LtrA
MPPVITRPSLVRHMQPRDPRQSHRAATPLELFFDLCFVVSVALAANSLHHGLVEDHIEDSVLRYCLVFFSLWWAWMNFTWFASAYDTDDGPYRVATFVMMAGALVIAAGVPRTFDTGNFEIMVVGYVILRLGMISLWWRASRTDQPGRLTAERYAIGLFIVQVGWVATLLLPVENRIYAILPLIAAELVVPMWAETAEHTLWHAGHIAERYGLFTMIVLGESVLAATIAFQIALDEGHDELELLTLAAGALVVLFSSWWLYFDRQRHDRLTTLRYAFTWGYGHWFIFASLAALGAGVAACIDYKTDHTALTTIQTGYTVAIPAAVFVLSIWALQVLPFESPQASVLFLVAAALILLAPLLELGLYPIALIMVLLVAADLKLRPVAAEGILQEEI